MAQESVFVKIGRKCRPLFLNVAFERLLKYSLTKFPDNKVLKILVPPSYMINNDRVRSFNQNGIKMELNLRHYNDHLTYWFSTQDVFLKNIVRIIQPNDVVIDVGINIGFYLLNFSKKARHGFVHGFEPNSKVLNYTKKNCSLNSFKNIKLNNFGLGNAKNSFQMAQINDNLGMNKIVATGASSQSFSIDVDVFDDYVDRENLSQIDVMKIDVEGYEMNVLLGAAKSIAKWKPFLFIEIDEENLNGNDTSFSKMQDWLLQKRYVVLNAITLEELKKEEISNHFDILAVHHDKMDYFQSLFKI